MKIFPLFLITFLSVFFVNAQNKKKKSPDLASKPATGQDLKIAYIYEDYIFENYHEVKNLEKAIEQEKAKMQDEYNKMALDYQTKYLAYQSSLKNLDSMTTEKLSQNLLSVQNTKKEVDDFEQKSARELQDFTQKSVQKIKLDINEAINAVAKDKSYPWVWTRNKSESLMNRDKVILYYEDNGKHNLSDAVLLKLGSTPPSK